MKPSHAFMGDLQEASRPAILVGGGAHKARAAIMAFADRMQVPVFRTWNALDVATDDHPCYAGTVGTYGGPGRNFGLQNADLLLILGCRISGRITGGQPQTFARGAKRYWVDLDADLLAEHEVRPHTAVCMDAGEFISGCNGGQHEAWTAPSWRVQWLATCRRWLDQYDPVQPRMLTDWHHYGFMRMLSQAIPADAIVAYDTGGNAIMMGHCFQSKAGQRIFSSNGNTPMGGALCYAIGAWFAEPGRPIVCIIGDGGMQLNIQELQTIKHYGIPLKVFIINNFVLGNTKSYQLVNGKNVIACDKDSGYSVPDFCKVATAYGLRSAVIDSWFQCAKLVYGVMESAVAEIVDVRDRDRCQYEPRISRWDTPIEDAYPYLPRSEFRSNMNIEPMKGWEQNG